jgi:hypothetical protein
LSHYKLTIIRRKSDHLPMKKVVQKMIIYIILTYVHLGLNSKKVFQNFSTIFFDSAQCVRCGRRRKFDADQKEIKIWAIFQIIPTHMCCAVVKGLYNMIKTE